MSDAKPGSHDRSNLEKIGESAGAIAGRAADLGLEMTSGLVRSAAEMLGGWWSSDEPVRAAGDWTETAEQSHRSHYEASAGGVSATGSAEVGETQPANAVPKSKHGAMKADSEVGPVSGSASGTGTTPSGAVGIQTFGDERASASAQFDSASDGFARARPGYQLGYVAKRNPAYANRSFAEVEPELRRVWESRAQTISGKAPEASDPVPGSESSWPEVRGFVDFAFQQDD